MGLFGRKKQQRATVSRVPEPMQIKMPIARAYELPKGTYDGYVVLFDARPLGKLRKGAVLKMTMVRGDYVLWNVYSEQYYDSRDYEDTNCLLTYRGYAIGYMTGLRQYVTKLVEKHGTVGVYVRYDGIDPHQKIPSLWALLPTSDWFRAELEIPSARAQRDPRMVTVNIWSDQWKAQVSDGEHDLTLRKIPTPKGSSAKPHIEIILDGVVCAEVTARNACYSDLASLLDVEIEECWYSRNEYDTGSVRNRLEIKRKDVPDSTK